jgi:hypothetical protein
MELPPLDAWTYDTVVKVVDQAAFEPGGFDFKEVLHANTGDANRHNLSIARAACAMANTDGGFLVFGVVDPRKSKPGPRAGIVGVPLGEDLRKELGHKLTAIQRPVRFDTLLQPISLPSDPNRGIFVAFIGRSHLRPHMVASEGVFYRRGDGGSNERMDFHQVQDQMLLAEERLRKVTLLRLELADYRTHAQNLIDAGSVMHNLLRIDSGAFKPLLADVCTLLPDDLLQALLGVARRVNGSNWIQEQLMQQFITQIAVHGHTNAPQLESAVGDTLRSIAVNLAESCEMCEERLAQLFGPLSSAS